MHKYICKILKHSMLYFFFKFTKMTFFQAVKLVASLKTTCNTLKMWKKNFQGISTFKKSTKFPSDCISSTETSLRSEDFSVGRIWYLYTMLTRSRKSFDKKKKCLCVRQCHPSIITSTCYAKISSVVTRQAWLLCELALTMKLYVPLHPIPFIYYIYYAFMRTCEFRTTFQFDVRKKRTVLYYLCSLSQSRWKLVPFSQQSPASDAPAENGEHVYWRNRRS